MRKSRRILKLNKQLKNMRIEVLVHYLRKQKIDIEEAQISEKLDESNKEILMEIRKNLPIYKKLVLLYRRYKF